jgi:hypothetical protein
MGHLIPLIFQYLILILELVDQGPQPLLNPLFDPGLIDQTFSDLVTLVLCPLHLIKGPLEYLVSPLHLSVIFILLPQGLILIFQVVILDQHILRASFHLSRDLDQLLLVLVVQIVDVMSVQLFELFL